MRYYLGRQAKARGANPRPVAGQEASAQATHIPSVDLTLSPPVSMVHRALGPTSLITSPVASAEIPVMGQPPPQISEHFGGIPPPRLVFPARHISIDVTDQPSGTMPAA